MNSADLFESWAFTPSDDDEVFLVCIAGSFLGSSKLLKLGSSIVEAAEENFRIYFAG